MAELDIGEVSPRDAKVRRESALSESSQETETPNLMTEGCRCHVRDGSYHSEQCQGLVPGPQSAGRQAIPVLAFCSTSEIGFGSPM